MRTAVSQELWPLVRATISRIRERRLTCCAKGVLAVLQIVAPTDVATDISCVALRTLPAQYRDASGTDNSHDPHSKSGHRTFFAAAHAFVVATTRATEAAPASAPRHAARQGTAKFRPFRDNSYQPGPTRATSHGCSAVRPAQPAVGSLHALTSSSALEGRRRARCVSCERACCVCFLITPTRHSDPRVC